MKIIDVHAHYDDEQYNKDIEEVLKDSKNSGVEYIINAGSGVPESIKALEIAKKHERIYATIGIHPENVDRGDKLEEIMDIYVQNKDLGKIVAIGEIGLDYYYTKENREQQIKLFKDQLELAKHLNLPVQIHSRDASIDTVAVLDEIKMPKKSVMFHCFDLNEQVAGYIIKNEYMISLGGNITYKRTENAIKVIKEMPLERIMTETDSPYLAPEGYRGKRNSSKNIVKVIEKIAEIKNLDCEVVAKHLYENAKKFYNLK